MQKEAEKEGSKVKNQNDKLKSIALFDKLIKTLMNKIDVKMLTISKQYLKWSFRPTLKRENNCLMEQQLSSAKCVINLNTQTCIGISILDLTLIWVVGGGGQGVILLPQLVFS